MKIAKYLTIILFVAPQYCFAQADTIFYNSYLYKTTSDTPKYYLIFQKEYRKSYNVTMFYSKNNQPYMTGHFSDLKKETREGAFTYYDENGFKTMQGNYENNKRNGKWIHYFDSSTSTWYTDNFSDGNRDGELVCYYKNGKLKRKEQHHPDDTTVTGVCYDEAGKEIPFTRFETLPAPTYDMNAYLSQNLTYPEKARKSNIHGRVIIRFIVNEDGSISNVETIKKIGGGCDEVAASVVAGMPAWQPGIQEEKAVKVVYTLPIVFRLR